MVELPDARLIRAIRLADQEREARLKAEHQMKGLKAQLTQTQRRLAAALVRTTDAKPKSDQAS